MRDWRFWGLLALFVLVVGLHLMAPRLDSDQAITGLMGVHILRGELPIFFWGQHHAGIPESYGAAVTFFLLGISRTALCLVPALAALGLVLALYRTGTLLFGRGAGLLAILFATVVSPYVIAHYVRARAYYIEHLLVGQIVLLGAALWLARLSSGAGVPTVGSPGRLGPAALGTSGPSGGPPPGPPPPGGRTPSAPLSASRLEAARDRALVAMGLAGGVGLYFGFQIVDALVPATLALLLVDPGLPLRRGAWLGLGAFLFGSLPFWVYNLTHAWATFDVGVRFQGAESGWAAARSLVLNHLPVILGIQDYVNTPPYLPWPFFLVVPVVVGAATLLLAVRVLKNWRRLRRDPALAGEALVLATAAVTVGMVWYGRFLAVPRYLVPLAPPLALILARACQLTWRRNRVVAVAGAAAYLVAVGIPLVRDVAVLWPESRAAYQAERDQDRALFAFLEARGLRRAYAYEYWVTPRLTFDSGEQIIVAEPFNDKHPAFTQAVDASPRPVHLVRGSVGIFENWLKMLQVRSRRESVGGFTLFWDFSRPPDVAGLPRAGWTVRTSAGTGEPASLTDGQPESGWSSAPGPPGTAWVEVDLGQTRAVAGLALLTDHPEHLVQGLVVDATDSAGASRTVARAQTGGFSPFWANGALRAVPTRAMTVLFPPVEARRLRLTELAPAGNWSVSELFLLEPAAGPGPGGEAIDAGHRLEAAGSPGPALARYHEAMRRAPDDPEGYREFLRLAGDLNVLTGFPAARGVRYTRLGLAGEARIIYARLAAGLGPDVVNADLAEARAAAAAAMGDATEATRLRAQAEAARTPPQPVAATFGRGVELVGCQVTPRRLRPGEALDLVAYWRLREPAGGLAAYVHFVGVGGQRGRFAEDHRLPERIRGLTEAPQAVMERRRILVPAETPPGTYRVVLGVWHPASGQRLRRWIAGVLPAWSPSVDVGTVEVVP
jgi:4-amino-4-deoxy-L-arabinose transferase-like glycosyltransferase